MEPLCRLWYFSMVPTKLFESQDVKGNRGGFRFNTCPDNIMEIATTLSKPFLLLLLIASKGGDSFMCTPSIYVVK